MSMELIPRPFIEEHYKKVIFDFQKQVDEKLKQIYDSFICVGYKKEDFCIVRQQQRPFYYGFMFGDELVYEIEFKHKITYMHDGNINIEFKV